MTYFGEIPARLPAQEQNFSEFLHQNPRHLTLYLRWKGHHLLQHQTANFITFY